MHNVYLVDKESIKIQKAVARFEAKKEMATANKRIFATLLVKH